jgi:hypothetical protein
MWGVTEEGYYWVKFYNHRRWRICYWNGSAFEAFKSDFAHDEIESVNQERIVAQGE